MCMLNLVRIREAMEVFFMINNIINLIKDEEGATIAEYALLLGLILVAVVTVVTAFGTNISSAVSKGSAQLIT